MIDVDGAHNIIIHMYMTQRKFGYYYFSRQHFFEHGCYISRLIYGLALLLRHQKHFL